MDPATKGLARKILTAVLAVTAVSAMLYSCFIEPRWPKTTTTSIPVARMQAAGPLRILHLTDFHLSPPVSLGYLRESILQGLRQNPDIICLTGDFITHRISDASGYGDVLSLLPRAAPTYACPGNHDGGRWAGERRGYPDTEPVRALLEGAGIEFLENRMVERKVKGVRVVIGGLGDIWAQKCFPEDIAARFDSAQADLKVLLIHNPDAKIKAKALDWDLLLAGHTHGGQLILPVIGAPFAPIRDKSMVRGLHEYDGRPVYVSAGLGNLHGIRFNSRPEVSVLEVTSR